MQWLTALLAFAVTMLIFAMIVSALVEAIHRVMRHRSQGLRLMLESLYERVLKQRLAGALQDDLDASKFASIILENRALTTDEGVERSGAVTKFMRQLVQASVLTDIPVEQFTQKLVDNRIVKNADGWTEEIVKDVAQKYESFGHEFSSYFERRARVFSLVIAFLVAWLFYVHPYNLASTYFKNPELASDMASRAQEAHADYRALEARLSAAVADATVNQGETAGIKEAIEELKTSLNDSTEKANKLAATGVPLGWPNQDDVDRPMRKCFSGGDEKSIAGFCWQRLPLLGNVTVPSLLNAFWLLIGGLLVGLGAPFWAQAVSNLSATRDVTRKVADIVNPSRAGPAARGIGPGSGSGAQSTAFATFSASLEAARSSIDISQAKAGSAEQSVSNSTTAPQVKTDGK